LVTAAGQVREKRELQIGRGRQASVEGPPWCFGRLGDDLGSGRRQPGGGRHSVTDAKCHPDVSGDAAADLDLVYVGGVLWVS